MEYKIFNQMSETERKTYDNWDFEDQLKYEAKLLEQEIQSYVKEYNRLLKKYDYTEQITIEDVTSKPYFYNDESDTLMFDGGKNMAQYNGYNGGLWGCDEVDMWKKEDIL